MIDEIRCLTLIRYVERDLDAAETLEVEQLLEIDEAARADIKMLRGTSSVLEATFRSLRHEKPPGALVKKIREFEHRPQRPKVTCSV